MIEIIQDIPALSFFSMVPDLSFKTSSSSAKVELINVDLGGYTRIVFSEEFYPDKDQVIRVRDIAELLESYIQRTLLTRFRYRIVEGSTIKDKQFSILYCKSEVNIDAKDFAKSHFLTLMQGPKKVMLMQPEYVHMVAVDPVTIKASLTYDKEGVISHEEKTITSSTGNMEFITLDVSPSQFEKINHKLVEYRIIAGDRELRYLVDNNSNRYGPVFIFTNSFGCQEVFTCFGKVESDVKMEREQGYSDSLFRTFHVEEEKTYKAMTGNMDNSMAVLALELIRSEEIYLAKGKIPGKEVAIKSSEIKEVNDVDNYPNYMLEYRLSQRNHNILDLRTEGRIFDHTFDHSFN